jgi:hypothetical protein
MGGGRVQNERELIGEILGGSQAAVEVLVNRHYKEIFSYIYRSTGQYHTSFDLTQEVFIKMMGALNRFDIRSGNFSNWLYKTLIPYCHSMIICYLYITLMASYRSSELLFLLGYMIRGQMSPIYIFRHNI